jgi:beta-propeller repeat-containing protein
MKATPLFLPAKIRRAMIPVCAVCLAFGLAPTGTPEISDDKPAKHKIASGCPDQADLNMRERMARVLVQQPLLFEPNLGQADSEAPFMTFGGGRRVFVYPDALSVSAGPASPPLSMRFVNSNKNAALRGVDLQETRLNYLQGNDPRGWHRRVPTYSRLTCAAVYPAIDMDYRANDRRLEYDFVVSPGGDPSAIRMEFQGAEQTRLDPNGDLILIAAGEEIRHKKPVAYQAIGNQRTEVPARFVMAGDGSVLFQVGDYDTSRELTIDPLVVYSTYIGGSEADIGRAIYVNSAGVAYIAGDSRSSDFTHGTVTNSDVFVGQIRADGGVLSYSFFGGRHDDTVTGVAVDADGNMYVCGSTKSDDYPAVHSINPTLSGTSDAFVTKLKPDGTDYIYSTLIGGSADEDGVSMALDSSRNVYISGRTTSSDFPTVNPIQSAFGGGDSDSFVAKIAPEGSLAVYSTYLGGSGAEDLQTHTGIAIDSGGDAFVTGDTLSTDFPMKNPLQATKGGSATTTDAFVTKINPDGSDFVYSTYLGGSSDDNGLGIALDSAGSAFVVGKTASTSFPGSSSTRPAANGVDGFVAKLNAAGSAYAYLTFIGGHGDDSVNAVAVDSLGDAVITGNAGDGLTTVNSIQSYFTGQTDVLVGRLTPAGAVNFMTYLGGSGSDIGNAIAILGSNVFVIGATDSPDYILVQPFKTTNGNTDVLVSKLDLSADSNKPIILKVTQQDKQLTVFGQNFDNGAQVRVNDIPKATRNGSDPTQILIAPRAGKKAKPGKTIQLQVENGDGKRSNIFLYHRPA